MKKIIIPIIIVVIVLLAGGILFAVMNSNKLTVASGGKSKYTIICKDTLADLNTANFLGSEISKKTTAKLRIRTEDTAPDAKGYEIVLGETNREIDVDTSTISDFGFIIKAEGNRIHIVGKNSSGTYNGVKYFLEKFIDGKKIKIDKNINITEDGLSMVITSIKTEIVIPGLSKEYTFLHVSDTHMTASSDTDEKNIRAAAYERSAMFLPADGIASADRFPSFFLYAEKVKADMVLLTGDIADFPTSSNIGIIRESFKNSKVEPLYVMGNHDWSFSWDYHSEATKAAYIPLYKDVTNNDPSFQVKVFDDLQIIAIDNSTNQVTNEQYEKTKKQLENGLPTIIIMHVPLYIETLAPETIAVWKSAILMGPGGVEPSEATRAFYNMVTDENNKVYAIFAGHVHFDHIDEFLPGRKQIITRNGNDGYCRIVTVKGK